MTRIVIFKDKKRAFGQEYRVQFIDNNDNVAHEKTVLGHDLKWIDKAYKRSWQGAPINRTWLKPKVIVDNLNEKEADCLHCDTQLTMRYIKAKGPRCPRCKKTYKKSAKSLTEHFAATGEEKKEMRTTLDRLRKNTPLRLRWMRSMRRR